MPDLLIRGSRLHVEEFGRPHHPAVLFLHGGPGMGSYHFEAVQSDRLRSLHLICLDQRGVLRSAPLADDTPCTITDILADCEEVRRQLGMESWSIIGHSFGGYLALRYASIWPSSVEKVVLENPSLDPSSSSRSLLVGAAYEYLRLHDGAAARSCLALAYSPAQTPGAVLWGGLADLLGGLGDRRENLYVHGENKRAVDEIIERSPFPADWWARGGVHQARLVENGQLFAPVLDLLRSIPNDLLLIQGLHDRVFAMDQLAACLQSRPDAQWRVFGESGHFVHLEEPESFAACVLDFLN